MKLIVGLGNPGKEYENTRHNVGFLMLDYFFKEQGIASSFKFEKKFNAEIAQWIPGQARNDVGREKVLLVKPMTFMNLSGKAVKGIMEYYKIDKSEMLVISDDMDIPLGEIRLRKTGRSGGHNGLQSIIDEVGSDEIMRVKLGIGRPVHNATQHVLENFTKEESELFDKVLVKGDEILTDFIRYVNQSFPIQE